jgi:tetratricopeptide (TPR) repeat protein
MPSPHPTPPLPHALRPLPLTPPTLFRTRAPSKLCAAGNFKAMSIRASCWMKKKSYERAIEDYSLVIQQNPADVPALFHRGSAFEKLGFTTEAIADYTRVLALDPNHVNAAYARAACYNRKGQFSEAIEDYNLALSKDKGRALLGGAGAGAGAASMAGMMTPGGMSIPGSPMPLGSMRKGSFRVGVEEYMRSREAVVRERLSASTPLHASTYSYSGIGFGAPGTARTIGSMASPPGTARSSLGAGGGGSGATLMAGTPLVGGGGPGGLFDPLGLGAGTGPLDVSTIFPNRDGSPSPSPSPSPPVSPVQNREPPPASLTGRAPRPASAGAVAPTGRSATAGMSMGGQGAGTSSSVAATPGASSSSGIDVGAGGAFRPRGGVSEPAFGADSPVRKSSVSASSPSSSPVASVGSSAAISTPLAPASSSSANQMSTSGVGSSAGAAAAEADNHHAKGFALRRKGDFAGAIAEYTKAIELDPQHFKAYFNRCVACARATFGACVPAFPLSFAQSLI